MSKPARRAPLARMLEMIAADPSLASLRVLEIQARSDLEAAERDAARATKEALNEHWRFQRRCGVRARLWAAEAAADRARSELRRARAILDAVEKRITEIEEVSR